MANRNQAGQPMYLGGDSIYDIYLGDHQISEMYLGEDLVYSSGPFVGLKITPKNFDFTPSNLTSSIKIKSSETWTLTTPSWLTASQATGDTGETIVTLTATTQTADTSGNISIASANFSASATANFYNVAFVDFVHSTTMRGDAGNYLDTGIIPDNTTYAIFNGIFKYGAWGKTIGYDANDNNDWRLFMPSVGGAYVDVGNQRAQGGLGLNTTTEVELEFGNLYAENVGTGQRITGTTNTNPLTTGETILIDLGLMWYSRLRIYTQGVLVFDGKAAEQGGNYGIFDQVSSNFLTTNDFTIVSESRT